jgi:hypothetical protein
MLLNQDFAIPGWFGEKQIGETFFATFLKKNIPLQKWRKTFFIEFKCSLFSCERLALGKVKFVPKF